ncbi:MAG TPA: RnfABCDGE type electron transport complex subunit G [Candidatus Atribacteria bacterium]|nr:RnfABCDGE type electron transport complex subunit G [Candidatus Atribacteria bacterium]HPT77748.1 RnfABCDGE type electron transport complex subunit G [Candidatus Atribacteria bacterium]
MHDMLKLGFRLFIITVIATFALALTNMLTAEPIQEQIRIAEDEARKAVLSNAESFEAVKTSSEEDASGGYPYIMEVYKGIAGNEVTGYTIKVANRGYGGKLIIIAGVNSDGNIEGVRLIQHSETPGLGAKAEQPDFMDQFSAKSANGQLVLKEDISAISGATITSRAVTNAVNAALDYYRNELSNGGGK